MAGILETYNKMNHSKTVAPSNNDFLSVYYRMASGTSNDLSISAAYRRLTGNEIVDDLRYGSFFDRLNTFGKLLNQSLDKYNTFESSFDESKYYNPADFDADNTKKLAEYANKFLLELENNKYNYDTPTYEALKNYLKGAASAAAGISDTTSKIKDYYSQFKDESEYNIFQKYQKTAKEYGFNNINEMVDRINTLRSNIQQIIDAAPKKTSTLPGQETHPELQNNEELKKLTDEYKRLMQAYNQVEHGAEFRANPNPEEFDASFDPKQWREFVYDQVYQYSPEKMLKDAKAIQAEKYAYSIDRKEVNRRLAQIQNAVQAGNPQAREEYKKLRDDLYQSLAYTVNKVKDDQHFNIKAAAGLSKLQNVLTDDQKKEYDTYTQEEKYILGYLYETEGRASVDEFMHLMEEAARYREGLEKAKNVDTWWEKTLLSIGAGLDQFISGAEGFYYLVTGNDKIPTTHTIQYTSQAVREQMERQGDNTILYDLGTTTFNMVPSVMAGVVTSALTNNPAAGTYVSSALMGTSAAGNAYQQAIREGYTVQQAQTYGLLIGVSETCLQSILGGAGSVSGTAVKKAISSINSKLGEKAFNTIAKVMAKASVQFGVRALGEFTEEYLQDVLEPVFRNICFDENNEFKPFSEEALYSGILGALSSIVFSGAGVVVNNRANIQSAVSNTVNTITEKAKSLLPSERAAAKFESVLTDVIVNNTITEADAKAILSDSNQSALFTEATGIQINENTTAQDIVSAVKNLSIPTRNIESAYRTAEQNAPTREISRQVEFSESTPTEYTAETKDGVQVKFDALKGIQAKFKESDTVITINGIESVKDKTVYVKTADGGIASVKDLTFDNPVIEKLYEEAAEYDTRAARAFVGFYNGENVNEYSRMFYNMYVDGKLGIKYEDAVKANSYYAKLFSGSQMRAAYYAGQNAVRAEQSRVAFRKRVPGKTNAKGIYIDSTEKGVSELAKELYTLIAKKTGADVETVDNLPNDAKAAYVHNLAKFMFSQDSDTKTADIIHEMSEFWKEYDKDSYEAVKNRVLEWFAQKNSKSLDELIKKYQSTYKTVDKTTTYRDASGELARDAFAAAFASEEGINDFMNWLHETDTMSMTEKKSFIEKIKNFIDKIIQSLKNFISGHEMSKAARELLDANIDYLTQLRDDILDGWNRAIENYKSINAESDISSYSIEVDSLSESRSIPDDIISDAEAPKVFELAKQSALGANAQQVYEARLKINTFALKDNAAEVLGITREELNRHLRTWQYYKSGTDQQDVIKGMKILQRNKYIAEGNRREMRETRQKILKIAKEFSDKLLKPTDAKHIPEDFKGPILQVLQALDFTTDKMSPNKGIGAAFTALQAKYERIRSEMQDYTSDGVIIYDGDIAAMIDSLTNITEGKRIVDLTQSELDTVYNVLKAFRKMINNSNKMFSELLKHTVREAGENTITELKKQKPRFAVGLGNNPIVTFAQGDMALPIYFFEQFEDTPLYNVAMRLFDGETKYADLQKRSEEFARNTMAKYHYFDWDTKKKIQLTTANGDEIELSLGEALSLYATFKREKQIDTNHLETGGFVLESDKSVQDILSQLRKIREERKNPEQRLSAPALKNVRFTDYDFAQLQSKLSNEQIAFVDEMVRYLSQDMAHEGNQVSLAMYDYLKFTEKYYFPLKVVDDVLKTEPGSTLDIRIKNQSFTKNITRKSNAPILIGDFIDVWAAHVDGMASYAAYTLPIEDLMKVWNYKSREAERLGDSVKAVIKNTFGDVANDYIKNLLTDLNRGSRKPTGEALADRLIASYKSAAVAANLRVVVQQPMTIFRAMSEIEPKYFVGLVNGWSEYQEAEMYAPITYIKNIGYFDTNMAYSFAERLKAPKYEGIKKIAELKDKRNRRKAYSFLAQKMDELAWGQIWAASKKKVQTEHPDLTPGSQEYFEKVSEVFTNAIRKTQVYDSVLSRSQGMRSRGAFAKSTFAFMGEPTKILNMLVSAGRDISKGRYGKAMMKISSVIVSSIFTVASASLISAMRDDDDEKQFVDKYIDAVIDDAPRQVLGLVPYIRDIAEMFDGYRPQNTALTPVYNVVKALNELMKEDRKKSDAEALSDFALALSSLFGAPFANIKRDLMMLYNTAKDLLTDELEKKSAVYDEDLPLETRFEAAKNNYNIALKDADGSYNSKVSSVYYDLYFEAVQAGNKALANEIRKYLIQNGRTPQSIQSAYNKRLQTVSPYSVDDLVDIIDSGGDAQEILKEMRKYGYDNETVRTQLTKHYKSLYQQAITDKNDEEALRIRKSLYYLGVGFTVNTFLEWANEIKK